MNYRQNMLLSKLLRNQVKKYLSTNSAKQLSTNAQTLKNEDDRILKSLYPDVQIPDCNLVEFIWKDLGKWSDKVAMECSETGRKYKYSEIYKYSRALAANLRNKLKLQDNDVVAIVLPNVPEYGIAVMGILQANCIATLANPIYTADEIYKQLENSDAKCVITSNVLFPTVQASVKKLQRDFPIMTIDTIGGGIPSGSINLKEFWDNTDTSVLDKLTRRLPEDMIFLPYSSGTTGLPKGVELRNKNLVANLWQTANFGYKYTEETTETHQDGIPAILPFYHIYGLNALLVDKLAKGCQIQTLSHFTTKSFINILKNYKSHQIFAVPPIIMLMTLNDDIKPEYLAETRIINSGAAPLGKSDIEQFKDKMKKDIPVTQGYGLTETSPLVAAQHPNMDIKLGSIGRIVPNTECMIVDIDTGKALGPNESGELYIRGPQVMKGYYKNPEANKNTFTEDGWFKTGDLARYDEEQYFYITDRLKELIKVKGLQVAPAELEALLRTHPNVDDVAVVGIPDVISGEVPKAFVVVSKNSTCSEEEIEEFVESKVAKHKRLAGGVVFVDAIPKNPSGKILRRQLRDTYKNQ